MPVNFLPPAKKRWHHFAFPSEANGHRPHFVHPKALHGYSAFLIAAKILALVLLFITFPSQAEFSTVTSSRIIELTNKARSAAGLPILTHSSILDESALMKAKDMIKNSYFGHNSPDGLTPWEWFKAAGYNYTFAGENLAMNFTDAEDAIAAWLASPTHAANLMNSNYDEIGVGVAIGKIDGRQTTVVVQHFGKSFVPAERQVFTPVTATSSEIAGAGITQTNGGDAIEVTFRDSQNKTWWEQVIYYSKKFSFILLIFIAINLFLTIFIRIKVQHKSALIHIILVIIVGLLMLFTNVHFLENVIGGSIKIL